MGNSMSQRVNSSSASTSGLGFYFSYSVDGNLAGFSSQQSNFTSKHSPPAGLKTIPFNSNSAYIVFPPTLIALEILYTAPGELWNWNHPKRRGFPATHTISARDGIMIPAIPEDITRSEEYTCVISNKDGYPIMTHLYGNTVVDCHPVPRSMVAANLDHGDHHRTEGVESSDEFVKHCYICRKYNKEMSDNISIDKDGALCNKEFSKKEMEARNKIWEKHDLECANKKFFPQGCKSTK